MWLTGTRIERGGIGAFNPLGDDGFSLRCAPSSIDQPYYVDGNDARACDAPACGTTDRPWATIAYAVARVPANSLIRVRQGHTESAANANSWPFANTGIKVLGLGSGDERPTITFSGGPVGARIFVSPTYPGDFAVEGSIALMNLRFINAIDSQTAMVVVASENSSVIGCHVQQGDGSTQALLGVVADFSCHNAKILRNQIVTGTAGGAYAGVFLLENANNVEVAHNWIYGDFDDACIQNNTGHVCTLLNIHRNVLTNLKAAHHAIQLVSASTGVIAHNVVNCARAAVGTLGAIDPGACYCIENYGSDGDGDVSGVLNPAADAA